MAYLLKFLVKCVLIIWWFLFACYTLGSLIIKEFYFKEEKLILEMCSLNAIFTTKKLRYYSGPNSSWIEINVIISTNHLAMLLKYLKALKLVAMKEISMNFYFVNFKIQHLIYINW